MTDTINVAVPVDLVFAFRKEGEPGACAVPVGQIAPAGILYLLQNGWSQSMTDTATSARAKVLNDAIAEWTKATGRSPNATEKSEIAETNARAIADAEAEALAKRCNAIIEGTLTAGQRGGGGPRKSPLEAYLWERAKAEAIGRLRKAGKALPKDTADANAVIEKVLAHFRTRWEKEFAKGGDDLDILNL